MPLLLVVVANVVTLTLGLRPRQGFGKVWAKKEAWESHLMLLGVWENVREWTSTLPSELPLWELESWWISRFSESNCKGQNTLNWKVFYIIEKILECRSLKWACMIHLVPKTQVMAKRRARSQIDNLTLDH
jgi:hypothetical protein